MATLAPGGATAFGMRILVVEDEPRISDFFAQPLRDSGLAIHVVPAGPDGEEFAPAGGHSAVVLDAGRGTESLVVLERIRRAEPHVPVLVLSALAHVAERVAWLDHGADDCLGKPFALAELVARLRALVRRTSFAAPDSVLRTGDLEVDLSRLRVRRGGREIELTAREYAILVFLFAERGRPVGRDEIRAHVSDGASERTSNAIDVSICGLRSKLGLPSLIRTVRGVGYRLAEPESL